MKIDYNSNFKCLVDQVRQRVMLSLIIYKNNLKHNSLTIDMLLGTEETTSVWHMTPVPVSMEHRMTL